MEASEEKLSLLLLAHLLSNPIHPSCCCNEWNVCSSISVNPLAYTLDPFHSCNYPLCPPSHISPLCRNALTSTLSAVSSILNKTFLDLLPNPHHYIPPFTIKCHELSLFTVFISLFPSSLESSQLDFPPHYLTKISFKVNNDCNDAKPNGHLNVILIGGSKSEAF